MSDITKAAPQCSLAICASIAEITAQEWDACTGHGNPFVSHAFLSIVEDSGSAGGRSGWKPAHFAFRGQDGKLAACAPAYVKSHSYGEYVFDQGWAEALTRAGGRYYPKLQVASPFSPVPGPRLLRNPAGQMPAAQMAGSLKDACRKLGLSSAHVTFCSQEEWTDLAQAGWLQREGTQYHWQNQGYADFEGFLAGFNSRKRKSVRK